MIYIRKIAVEVKMQRLSFPFATLDALLSRLNYPSGKGQLSSLEEKEYAMLRAAVCNIHAKKVHGKYKTFLYKEEDCSSSVSYTGMKYACKIGS